MLKKFITIIILVPLASLSVWATDKSKKAPNPAAEAAKMKGEIQYASNGLPYLGCMIKGTEGTLKEDTLCQCRKSKKNSCATATINFDKDRYKAYNKYLGDKAPFGVETINLMEQVASTVKDISDRYYKGEKAFPETLKKEKLLAKLNADLKQQLATSPQAKKKTNNSNKNNAQLAELRIQYLDKLLKTVNHEEIKNNHSLHRAITQALYSPLPQVTPKTAPSPNTQQREIPGLLQASQIATTSQEPTPFNLMGLTHFDARSVLLQIEKSSSLAIQDDDDLFIRITKSYHKVGIPKLIDNDALMRVDMKNETKSVKSAKSKYLNQE